METTHCKVPEKHGNVSKFGTLLLETVDVCLIKKAPDKAQEHLM